MKDPTSINVTSYNQTGGITAHTVNLGQEQRHLDSHLVASLGQILLKYKRKQVTVTAVLGDQEALAFAEEIKIHLTATGYNVDGVNQGVFTKPVTGQLVETSEDRAHIIIGRNL